MENRKTNENGFKTLSFNQKSPNNFYLMIRTRDNKQKIQKLVQPKARVHASSAKASIYQFNRKPTVQKQHKNYFLNISSGRKRFRERL